MSMIELGTAGLVLLGQTSGGGAGAAGAGGAPANSTSGMSILEFIQAGGTIGYIIILLSFVALAIVVMHVVQIRESSLAPQNVADDLHEMLGQGRVDDAIEYCDLPDNSCFLTRVVAAGLSRYRRSPFGSLELKGALEEAGQEQVARLYRSTDALALVAGIAPMLGLLGTVVGINGAFATIATAEGFARPDQLAGDISLALVTTILGLTLAIPTTAAVTFFRNRIDTLAGDIGAVVDELAAHLEEERPAGAGAGAGGGGR
jgi:biopolymer transport protein ExbB